MFHYRNSHSKGLLSVWHKLMHDEHPANIIKGISMQHTWRQPKYPINITTKGSQTKHEESWQQVHPTNDSAYIKHESWKQVRNKIPHQTSNRVLCRTMHNKRSTRIHYIYLTTTPSFWIKSSWSTSPIHTSSSTHYTNMMAETYFIYLLLQL